jgi:hypothetical protein
MYDDFYKSWRARPFEAFDVVIKNGARLSISHPELICATDREHVVGIGQPDGRVLTIHLEWVKRVVRQSRKRGNHGE